MKTLIDIRRDLHKIPEIGFQEFKTQRYLLEVLNQLKTPFMTITQWETGMIIFIEGTDPTLKIGWRTDIDGLPIDEETGLPYASTHEGYMHACGHDFHMTIALGLVQRFTENRPKNSVVVFFQPAEEGPGGAEPMLDWTREVHPELVPDTIFACHIAPEYPVGTVATKPGMLFANTSEIFVDLKGLGGHAAYPHLAKDMIVAASQLVVQLQTIISRNLNPLDGAVITIGKMNAGTVKNIIAETAHLEGTIRTASFETMAIIHERVKQVCKSIELAFDAEVVVSFGSSYYQVNNDEKSAHALLQYADQFEGMTGYECPAALTGEDFGYFIKEIPGAMFWAGANTSYGLHHAKITPDESLIEKNIAFIESFIRQLS